MKAELVSLYELAVKHETVIQKVETGAYSQGIVSMRIPEKDRQSVTLPTQTKFPELFKTLSKEKHLKAYSAQMTRAKETYMRNLKAETEEKAKKTAHAKDEAKLHNIDLSKVDISKASEQQINQYLKESIEVSSKLKKEENELVDKIAAFEKLKLETKGRSLAELTGERDKLRIELQNMVKESKSLNIVADKQRRLLEKRKIQLPKHSLRWEGTD